MDFSFDQIINGLLEVSPDPYQHNVIQQSDLLVAPPQNNSPSKPICSKKRKSSIAFESNVNDNAVDLKKKKIIERQRRQEMSSLFRSLRLLLPIECLKGKRSIADHLHETVGYIRQLQKRIEDLNEKRDKLKKLLHPPSFSAATERLHSCSQINVTVKTTMAGVEVSVNTAFTGELNLSRVLNILIEEGLSIINCISTKVDGRLLTTIESEVNEGMSIDSAELQQNLNQFCNGCW